MQRTGLCYVIFWYLSIVAGYIMLFCPLLPVIFVSNRLYRKITDLIYEFWELYPTSLMERVVNVKFNITGCQIRDENAVIIVNHRTRTDWNFLWAIVTYAVERRHNMKFILKDDIKNIPGIGWVMQLSCFLYIKRDRNRDMQKVHDYARYLTRIEEKCQILIFPEGTDLTVSTLEKSHSFAEKNQMPKYYQVLQPRTTGFAVLTTALLENQHIDAVYDLTLAYPDEIPQTEMVILNGKFPRNVCCSIARYSKDELGATPDDFKVFIQEKWRDKEDMLGKFYENAKSKDDSLKLNPHLSNIPGTDSYQKTDAFRHWLRVAFVFWSSLPIISMLCIVYVPWFGYYVVFHTCFLLAVTRWFGSFLDFEIALFEWKRKYFSHCLSV